MLIDKLTLVVAEGAKAEAEATKRVARANFILIVLEVCVLRVR